MELQLENGNHWRFVSVAKEFRIVRIISSLLNLQNLCDSEEITEGVIFPFFPFAANASYTFFDLTRDTIKYFYWLKQLKTDSIIVMKEDERVDDYDVLANLSVINRVIAIRNEIDGGFLVHGVLLEHEQGGVILAGASGVGKTTSARRTPNESWVKCSDDLTLVIRDESGNYFAHPWPRMYTYVQGELRYDSQRGVPLKGLFFLVHEALDLIKLAPSLKAIAMLQSVTDQAFELPDPSIDPKGVAEMRVLRLENMSDFVRKVPTYELFHKMIDPFWKDIEALVLSDEEKG